MSGYSTDYIFAAVKTDAMRAIAHKPSYGGGIHRNTQGKLPWDGSKKFVLWYILLWVIRSTSRTLFSC